LSWLLFIILAFGPKLTVIRREHFLKIIKKIFTTLCFLGEIQFLIYKILSLYSHRTMLKVKNLSQHILNSLFVFRECAKILFYHSGRIRQKYLFIFRHAPKVFKHITAIFIFMKSSPNTPKVFKCALKIRLNIS
jgi:hypothetical protein